MNYMKQVAKILGVELGERFKIKGEGLKYHLTMDGLEDEDGDYPVDNDLLGGVLAGVCEIIKIPWKPKEEETYYHIEPNGDIGLDVWVSDEIDIALYAFGNCFKTKADAEAHKDEILAKMKEVLEE